MSWIAIGISVATAVIGTTVTVVGQQQQKKAAENTAKYNNKVAENESVKESRVANENIKRKLVENRRLRGEIASANAANGLAMEGTPLAVLGETQSTLERDILDIGYQASERSRALLAGGEMGIWSAKQTGKAITTQQYGTIASGLGSAASGYLSSSGKV